MPNRPELSTPLEHYMGDILLADSGWDEIKVLFRGEPGFDVPSQHLPCAVLHMALVDQAKGEEGYGEATGMRYWRYDGYISVDVKFSDIKNSHPDPDTRWADVPSYDMTKRYIENALDVLMSWAGPDGHLNPQVVSDDGKERSVELVTDTIRLGLARRSDSITNRGSFEFHVYTRRLT